MDEPERIPHRVSFPRRPACTAFDSRTAHVTPAHTAPHARGDTPPQAPLQRTRSRQPSRVAGAHPRRAHGQRRLRPAPGRGAGQQRSSAPAARLGAVARASATRLGVADHTRRPHALAPQLARPSHTRDNTAHASAAHSRRRAGGRPRVRSGASDTRWLRSRTVDSVTPCRARQRLAPRQASPRAAPGSASYHAAPRRIRAAQRAKPRCVPRLVARRTCCMPAALRTRRVANQACAYRASLRTRPRCAPAVLRAVPRRVPSLAACRPCCVSAALRADGVACRPCARRTYACRTYCAPAVLPAAPNLAARRVVRVFHVKHTHAANFWQPPLRIAYPKGPALPRASRPQPHFAALMAQIRSLVRWQTLARHPLKKPTWGFASCAPAKQGYQAVFASRHRTKLRICATFPQKRGSEGGAAAGDCRRHGAHGGRGAKTAAAQKNAP